VARGVDQVQNIGFAVARLVGDAHALGLDGDAPLALNIHAVEVLLALIAGRNQAGQAQDAVGQGRFAVVDMGDDAEIADVVHALPGARAPISSPRVCKPRKLYGICPGLSNFSRTVTIDEDSQPADGVNVSFATVRRSCTRERFLLLLVE